MLRTWLFACALLTLSSATQAQEKLRIVATTTDLRALAEAVGGDRVSVTHLVPPNVDAEAYQPKPQDLNRLREADLLLRVGVDYDLWLDKLVAQAKRPEIARGGERYVDCSFAIALLDVRGVQVGPGGGHAHGSGNPHYWLDPLNAEHITGTILEALVRIDRSNLKYYDGRREMFLTRLNEKMKGWEARFAAAKDRPLLAHHNSWSYLARRFRLNFAGFIEPKPGIPPSPAQLASLVKLIEAQRIHIIVRQPHEPAQSADFLARKTGAKVVLLITSVGALPQVQDYFALFDYNAEALSAAR